MTETPAIRKRVLLRKIFLATGAMCLFMLIAVGVLVAVTPSPMPHATLWPVSPALLDKNGDLFHARLSADEEFCLPIPLDRMGRWLPLVAMEVEDKRFHGHMGVDPLALARAAIQNIRAGAVVSGASTITCQVVRMTFPSPRTFSSKAREFAQALKLETVLSKNAILELYLNRAPFGGPVRGVEAAARSYFNKKANEVSLAEAALLIGMLRGPSIYRPDRNPEKTLERRDVILRRLAESGAIPQKDIDLALLEKLPEGRGNIPQRHRHFADIALLSLPANFWRKARMPVSTTLDPRIQKTLESRLSETLWAFPADITASGGVVDNATGALTAYVGNARFNPVERAHWVDCGASPRSPGSLLKPFIYLLAMEQGNLVPGSLLADTPLSFKGMAPRNYDRQYRGPVSARFALANSLNAPAVRVLRQAGGEASLQFLRDLGFSLLAKPAAHYGDSLTLGGCEVTLIQTLQAFSVLANLGVHRPLTALASGAHPGRLGETRLFSATGAYLVADILRDTGRMPPVLREALREQGRPVAFKTGTSYGLRDAWTAAYTPQYSVAVWLGNPEGLPHPALSGLPIAAPLALRLMRDLPSRRGAANWYDIPEGLERFQACTLSGAPASPFCPKRQPAWRIRGVSHDIPCSMHAMKDGTLQVTLPGELEEYARNTGVHVAARARVDITMPQPGTRFFLTPFASEQRIALACEGARGKVYWFMDQEFIGAQEKGASLLWPLRPGRHLLSLVDEAGNTASARFSVIDVLAKQPRLLELEP